MTPRRLLALLLLLPLAACGEGPPRPPEVGDPAPLYGARTLAGDSASLAALRGRVVLLNVWATWCHPCREEIPALEALHREYGARGLEVVGVSVDAARDREAVRRFASDFQVTYPVWLDPDERVSGAFWVNGVPSTFLVGRDGTLLWKHVGPVRADDPEMLRRMEQALASPSAAVPGEPSWSAPLQRRPPPG